MKNYKAVYKIQEGDIFIPKYSLAFILNEMAPSIFAYIASNITENSTIIGHSLQHGGVNEFSYPVYVEDKQVN